MWWFTHSYSTVFDEEAAGFFAHIAVKVPEEAARRVPATVRAVETPVRFNISSPEELVLSLGILKGEKGRSSRACGLSVVVAYKYAS